MGKVKNTGVKTFATELIKEHGDRFSEDFEKNKKALDSIKKIKSKKIRNIVAGYITKKQTQLKKTGI